MHRVKKKLRWTSLGPVLIVVVGIIALLMRVEPFFADANAQVRRLSVEQLEEAAHALGVHWQGEEEETPIVVDFGGAPADAPVAGVDQWLTRNSEEARFGPRNHIAVTGAKRIMVLRVYFNDYTNTSRYTKAEVEAMFDEMDQLWQNSSYGQISIEARVSDLYQLPDNRSAYIDDEATGDLSKGGKYWKVLNDAIDNAPAGLDWSDLDAIMVVMAETDSSQFHRGQGSGSCNLKQGPGGSTKNVGCAIFSENPSDEDLRVWGRWSHELGHAFQVAGPAHPSNYNSRFEQMDGLYPGQTGVFEKLDNMGFPGWLPESQYMVVSAANGEGTYQCLAAQEYRPADVAPVYQAIQAKITDDLYYMISVRLPILGDDLWDADNNGTSDGIPDRGVLIERVVEGADQWVTLQAPPGKTRDSLWQAGQIFSNDEIYIDISEKQPDEETWCVTVRFGNASNQPDVAMHPWRNPPGETWETTDIWVDSPVNGYDTYRYGQWNDLWSNPVPRGNGDDPAVGLTNRLYARVRNVGTQTATDVVVNWEITDPPGVGINGANGWAPIGSVDKNSFPDLAAIAPGDYVDVYVEWTPNFPISEEDLEAGRFAFHTCVRVIINQVTGETITGNQNGDGEQENISYFQAVDDDGSGAPSVYDDVIRLRNDDLVNPKTFFLSYESDVPDTWLVNVNNGVQTVELAPNEVREIPVVIKPQGSAVVGSVFGVDVEASSLELLVNDLDPDDLHPAIQTLAGARVEARVLQPVQIECRATDYGEIVVEGTLKGIEEFYDEKNPPMVMIQGVDGSRRVIPHQPGWNTATVNRDGTFSGYVYSSQPPIREVICLFAGTTELASAGTGYVPLEDPQQPTNTPTPPPTNTPTPTTGSVLIPYRPITVIQRPILGSTDLGLHGIEITQGIQCFDTSKGLATCPDNSLPVVTNKSTAARVYIRFTNTLFSSRNNIPVRLYMRIDGGAWQSMDATGKGLSVIDQSKAENSANFFFTIGGGTPRVVDFYAVVDPDGVVGETNESNNRYPSSGYVTMTFRPREGLDILGQRLRWDPASGGPWTAGDGAGSGTSGWTVNNGAGLWFNQLMPISDGGVDYSVASGFRDWTGSLSYADQHNLIEQMNGEYVLALIFTLLFGGDADDLVDHVYGWIPNDNGTFGHADMPVYPHAGGLGVVGVGTDDPGNSTDNPGAGVLIFGHELVHDYDVYHTNTADACGSLDGNSDFPYGSSSIQEYGFNPLTQKVYKPEDTHDLMSYCPSGGSKEGWISPFTWNKMYNDLAAAAAARTDEGEVIRIGYAGARLLRTNHASSLIVNATIDNPDVAGKQSGALGEMYKVGQGYNLVLPEGDYRVELRNAEGFVLESRSFGVSFESEYHHEGEAQAHHNHEHPTELLPPGDPDPTEKADVAFVMPWIEGTAKVVLLYEGTELDQKDVTGAAPSVIITQPSGPVTWSAGQQQTLTWSGSDADTPIDQLFYAVFFSHDGGQSWQLLQDGITGNSYVVDVDALAGGTDARFRVVASDGVNTGFDETDGAITIPNKVPMPVIMEPAPNTFVLPGTLIVLQGGASDLEDGAIPASELRWSSDVQGNLGTGHSIPSADLQAGEHQITLEATDSNGAKASTSVTIRIGHGIYLPDVDKP